jgi:hypothetical protein
MVGLHQIRTGTQEIVIASNESIEITPQTSVLKVNLQNTATVSLHGGRDGQVVVLEIVPALPIYTLTVMDEGLGIILDHRNPAALLWRRNGEWRGRRL